ncbi:hypothetical protein GS451_12285 [Rhodococcus hoagii]|nr:hypothetical protein [Prescottella equi]
MTFNDDVPINADRVSVGGGGGGRRGGKYVLGGGAGGLIVLVLALLLGGDPGSLLGATDGSYDAGTSAVGGSGLENCEFGVDANRDVGCRVAGTAESLDAVWGAQLPTQTGVRYEAPKVRLFSGAIDTGCGYATSDVGPFYCPADSTAYFDTSFFQLLVDRYGANAGPLAQEYVVAHEFGHHIQNQLGDIGRAQQDPRGAASLAVRTELQADCYAGLWAHYASNQPRPRQLAAVPGAVDRRRCPRRAVGRLCSRRRPDPAVGRCPVNPEGWTHGSSEQRQNGSPQAWTPQGRGVATRIP